MVESETFQSKHVRGLLHADQESSKNLETELDTLMLGVYFETHHELVGMNCVGFSSYVYRLRLTHRSFSRYVGPCCL